MQSRLERYISEEGPGQHDSREVSLVHTNSSIAFDTAKALVSEETPHGTASRTGDLARRQVLGSAGSFTLT